MKFTWGHAMLLALILFMVFILSFMLRLNISEEVSKNYYTEGINYQSQIEGEKNYNALGEKPSIKILYDGAIIHFPKQFNNENIKGYLFFFRPSDSKKDLKLPIQLDSNNEQKVPMHKFVKGKYNFILNWETDKKRYYLKQIIQVK